VSADFGEYLSHLAGEGCDLDAPVPHLGRRGKFRERAEIDEAADDLAAEYAEQLSPSPGPDGDSRAR
jgi:hypothetical protein